jgi:DNA-binding transcriptional MerR regulator
LLYDAKFVAMLEQLDLFATYTQEEAIKTTIKPLIERKLTPPAIVEMVEEQVDPAEEIIVSHTNAPAIEENVTPATPEFTDIQPFPLTEPINNNIETSDSQENTDIIPEETLKKRGRKSQKEMSLEAGRIDVPKDEILYSKQYYGIGEVATMFSVNTSLLRYWESEFDILKPRKNGKGDRFFRPDDIKNLLLIHHLLRERKYTIEGAKEFLKNGKKAREHFEAIEKLKAIKSFLLELKAGL